MSRWSGRWPRRAPSTRTIAARARAYTTALFQCNGTGFGCHDCRTTTTAADYRRLHPLNVPRAHRYTVVPCTVFLSHGVGPPTNTRPTAFLSSSPGNPFRQRNRFRRIFGYRRRPCFSKNRRRRCLAASTIRPVLRKYVRNRGPGPTRRNMLAVFVSVFWIIGKSLLLFFFFLGGEVRKRGLYDFCIR